MVTVLPCASSFRRPAPRLGEGVDGAILPKAANASVTKQSASQQSQMLPAQMSTSGIATKGACWQLLAGFQLHCSQDCKAILMMLNGPSHAQVQSE